MVKGHSSSQRDGKEDNVLPSLRYELRLPRHRSYQQSHLRDAGSSNAKGIYREWVDKLLTTPRSRLSGASLERCFMLDYRPQPGRTTARASCGAARLGEYFTYMNLTWVSHLLRIIL
ncbi:hypothetical protein PISMIDRAFT_544374 [Pisolithus microcarpus 441]|uniref:Unplaced genomic scaffold scaffold_68, whole genome shotgun sequence n=1 Tax=Pisolithus microcarpus 441 TaxID=765257 RepID=A0A0C9ZNP1_9AGAM|nr:hypothetical protein PISMIDRAFT_544374 [Pisolithus microcarpus 441]